MQQLTMIQYNLPSVFSQFQSFRFKLIVESKIMKQKHKEKLDIIQEMALQNQIEIFYTKMEQISFIYYDFWSQLLEDYVDIKKLERIGLKTRFETKYLHKYWKKLNKISMNLGNLNFKYGNYCYQVSNDIVQGQRIFDEIALQARNKSQITDKVIARIEEIF